MGAVIASAGPADEVERRYGAIREAMARDGLDAVIVCGSEYTGFDGAVTTSRASRSSTATRTSCCRSRATRRSSSRARRRYVGEHGDDVDRASRCSSTAPASGSPTACAASASASSGSTT